jgi:hypothetical protein
MLWVFATQSQTYNNEWINFNSTYYKFKVGRDGVYRIPQSTLASVGLGAVSVEQFKLFRNGIEVPLYTSGSSGVLPVGGYIEFWGEANDGKVDKALYRDSRFQHTDKISLQTDTAIYFLTTDAMTGKRFTSINNSVVSALPVEPYFMHTRGQYFRTKINLGFAAVVGEYVYSSSYDKGEYYSSRDITPSAASTLTDVQNNLFVYTGGPADAEFKFGGSGNALNTRSIRVRINGTQVKDTICDYFNDAIASASFPVSLIAGSSASVEFRNTAAVGSDRMVISHYEITYPREFNFGGAANFSFQLEAKAIGYNLEIANFNFGAAAPVLFDLTLNERHVGDLLSVPGKVKFILSGSTQNRNLVLVSQDNSNITTVQPTGISVKNFTDFNNAANQGDYLIITHPLLYNGTNGGNPINDYADYRKSITGGGHNVKTIEIDELVDQFAFGISKHPLSIKNFLRFARAVFAPAAPKNVLLIGHGVTYRGHRANLSNPILERLNMVPTWGEPASDMMLSSDNTSDPVPLTPIGRISAVSAKEVEDYLEKVKEYENAQQNNPHTIEGRLWMKNVMQVTGASDTYLGTVLCNYMNSYQNIISDTLLGGKTYTFCKSTVTPVEQFSNQKVSDLFEEGLSLLTYFGHSSSSTLEFNIDNPQAYNNQGKYPVFSVNGCNAGNFFAFSPVRLTINEALSEKFVLAKQRGSIAFIASTHFGITSYLNIYINDFYSLFANEEYGNSLGIIMQKASRKLMQATNGDYYARMHAEEITLHGDPALKMNTQPKPDYIIEESQVKVTPQFISVAQDDFKVNVKFYNIGRSANDSLFVTVNRQYPDNSIASIFRKKIAPVHYSDSLEFTIPIIATRDKGLNKIIVTLDSANAIAEMSESNNTTSKDFYIFEDELRPVSPYNYSIVNQQNIKLYASTANPLSTNSQYVMEIDTTENFNSALKISKTTSGLGGLIEFTPGMAFTNNTVYYWRTALAPITSTTRWSASSFVYKSTASAQGGFNQSHYFQHLKSNANRIKLSNNRNWDFGFRINDLFLRNSTYPTGSALISDYINSVNTNIVLGAGCNYNELIFQVLDGVSFKPWVNTFTAGTGLYNSLAHTCGTGRQYNFAYLLNNNTNRKKAMDFIDLIPDGAYVIVRTNIDPSPAGNNFADSWKADTSIYGAGNSLYHKLFQQGFAALDSFSFPRSWIFLFRKNRQSEFTPLSKMSLGIFDRITLAANCQTIDTVGTISSPQFGPARAWQRVYWKGKSVEQPSNDKVFVDVLGVDADGYEYQLFRLNENETELDISSVSANQYPYIKLKLTTQDSLSLTPYQLNEWGVDYETVPEGVMAPNIYFQTKDTLEIGEPLNFGVAFKNISGVAFDSIKIKAYILDKNNVSRPIELSNTKPLLAQDTVKLQFKIKTDNFPYNNTLYLEFNPEKHQPEQYSFNNFLFKDFYVKPDNKSPLLDITFDNVHILNRDIVSATPHIQIKLKDNAKFLLLNDTSAVEVQVKFPGINGEIRSYQFGGDTLRFTPASDGSDNTATIDFFPKFLSQIDPLGDEYELIVRGKDRSNNKAGAAEYRIAFKVIGKPMISNLLNYPNPFTTSTAFVFTITGNKVPDNMKIQILTVTGKLIREITKEELGTLHVGRNITDFKWDGTDQYGQRLANGVYLYRFITTLDGNRMEKYTQERDKNGEPLPRTESTDRFFNNGYGKMYLMR